MQWWEILRFVAGMHARQRDTWEQNRLLRHQLALMFCKEGSINKDPTKAFPLPWDDNDSDQSSEQDEESLQKLMDQLNAHNAQIKAQKVNPN